MKWVNITAHRIAHAVGVDYRRYNASNVACLRRKHHMTALKIQKVFDIGAHDGGYGCELREHGYCGEIVSFEPLAEPYKRLAKFASIDGRWTANRVALGSVNCEAKINVSAHPTSSSFLNMTCAHEQASPGSRYEGLESVRIERLKNYIDASDLNTSPTWLKVDVQGYEKHVLDGAESLLSEFAAIELELSLVPVYEGAPLIEEMISFLRKHGYEPISFEDVLVDPNTAKVFQVDGIFLRNTRS